MRRRNGFVSNSSSCSYIVAWEEKPTKELMLKSVRGVEYELGEIYWDGVYPRLPESQLDSLRKYSEEYIAELLYRMGESYTAEDVRGELEGLIRNLPSRYKDYPSFRKSYLRKQKYLVSRFSSSDPADVMYAEGKVFEAWDRYMTDYFKRKRAVRLMGIFRRHPERMRLYRFGTQCRTGFMEGDSLLIEVLRDEDISRGLFSMDDTEIHQDNG